MHVARAWPFRCDGKGLALRVDCTAHSIMYDVATGGVRPLVFLTDTWGSSGTVAVAGHLVQTGGLNEGQQIVGAFYPCRDM